MALMSFMGKGEGCPMMGHLQTLLAHRWAHRKLGL
jgi:hypothetical protein